MISSELPEILAMSDRILVMREGRLVGEFTREEATQELIAHAMMSEEVRRVKRRERAHEQGETSMARRESTRWGELAEMRRWTSSASSLALVIIGAYFPAALCRPAGARPLDRGGA